MTNFSEVSENAGSLGDIRFVDKKLSFTFTASGKVIIISLES